MKIMICECGNPKEANSTCGQCGSKETLSTEEIIKRVMYLVGKNYNQGKAPFLLFEEVGNE